MAAARRRSASSFIRRSSSRYSGAPCSFLRILDPTARILDARVLDARVLDARILEPDTSAQERVPGKTPTPSPPPNRPPNAADAHSSA